MSLLIYSQYTKPEGSLKFDDLVYCAKKKEIKALALTDHGNFSGIIDFYHKCLDSGIKPLTGMDFFCTLNNGKHIRAAAYIKNYFGYRELLKVVHDLKREGRTSRCGIESLKDLKNCFISLSSYTVDLLAEGMVIEDDFDYIQSQIFTFDSVRDNIFFHILYDEDGHNRKITESLTEFSTRTGAKLLAANPVYHTDKGGHRVKDFTASISGTKPSAEKYRFQYLGSTEEHEDKFPENSIENRRIIEKGCNFLIEDIPVKFPKLKFQSSTSNADFYALKARAERKTGDLDPETRKIIDEELAFIRKYNISDIIIFLTEVKKEYFDIYGRKIFFSGFINDLYIAYIFDLTLSSPVFAGTAYHRSVLALKKIHPQLTVIVSPEERKNLFEYLSDKFSKRSICFLSEYVKWHFPAVWSLAEKEYGEDRKLTEELMQYYSKNSRSPLSMDRLLENKTVEDILSKNSELKEALNLSLLVSGSFRNYNTNTGQLVISDEDVLNMLPVSKGSDDLPIRTSFYNMATARHFGVWNINIESNSYLDVREHFKLHPISGTDLKDLPRILIDRIKMNDLAAIPYFTFGNDRLKYLDTGVSKIWNLVIYLESAHSNFGFLFNRPSPEHPRKWYRKELEMTRGFIVFREQLYFICDKLFPSKDMKVIRKKLAESSGQIQFNSILGQIGANAKYSEACEYLRSAVQNSVFYLSFTDAITRVIIALRIIDLETKHPESLAEYFFSREVNSNGEWRKYISKMTLLGYCIKKFSISETVKKIRIKGRAITLPLFCIKGISPAVSDCIYSFTEKIFIESFQDFLEFSDKDIVKHKTVELLIRSGFFDIFNTNRRELEILNDFYYRSMKSEEAEQPELFDPSGIEIGTEETVQDYALSEKIRMEDELTGIIFSGTERPECEIYGFIKNFNLEENGAVPGIYDRYDFKLRISAETTDTELISRISEEMNEEGNCQIEIYFSDQKRSIILSKFLKLNDLSVYRVKKILGDFPFYFEIIKSGNEPS